ncbi:GNAT family N-acetyltransferase [Gemella sp. GH3]|uniref:GNAT family N-acetyltransferase n=1 Tax=unclassified Gemella TaxID=2624949 RepID=UPI0015D0BDD1|nr:MULTISPECIES: GNAT family N-acetyltransferase [unclassified Gemella]MBF0714475.1 GNAT family N-acetyltransferase [Gemella sp. GH3.1]NYS51427.1 GNAT family N-acetyltransferase [Gemella sp. GH3]
MIELRKIDDDNFQDCLSLRTSVKNKNYVDEVVYSFAEAWLDYEYYNLFAINLNDKVIGFVSMYTEEDHYQIINFLIDDAFQNKGYGKVAAKLCIDYLAYELNATQISLPVYKDNEQALYFWQKLGFYISENIESDYLWLRLNI